MKIWPIAIIVSVIATLAMSAVFVFSAMVALNGFGTSSEAMPTYLICNCVVWPLMVGITTAVSWGIFAIAKQKQPLRQIAVPNAIIVTVCLGILVVIAYFI